ncbi:hypothetical protein CI109_100819 [Kwoniella shandongensis]|uniref:Uncharacterized protein n=1 Tax=Kwoniella shandongensis TaxID=1734106 RepID=A0A5M6BPD9_9TREE|nr:uncharacterized protein CI109_006908 [Kwoniella shandongensis]KAA5524754.1 hypothetical protein CI109_006908 [Kwoniella shandongensis]
MSTNADEIALNDLLKRLAAPVKAVLPKLDNDHVSLLAHSLLPSSSRSARSLAYLCLSKFCDDVSKYPSTSSDSSSGDEYIVQTFRPFLETTFNPSTTENEDTSSQPESCVPATCLLAALFPLSPKAATQLLTTSMGEVGDPLAILLEVAELPSPLQPALAELLVAAAGTKPGREVIRERAMEWLKGAVEYQAGQGELGVLCAVALSKLGRQDDDLANPQGAEGGGEASITEIGLEDEDLCQKMMSHIEHTSTSPNRSTAIISTLEGLSILSLRPRIKHLLASSPGFLKSLVKLSPIPTPKGGSLPVTPRGSMDLERDLKSVETGLCYGLTTILVNLTSPKQVLSAEDEQMAKLRSMALSAKGKKLSEQQEEAAEDDEFESEEQVKRRVKAVIAAGGVGALTGLVRAESKLVKEGLGRLCRNLVEDKSDRLGFVRDGGFKVLAVVIRDLLASTTSTNKPTSNGLRTPTQGSPDLDVLPAFQALAKLVITTPPTLLFPPPHLTTSLNSLTPLYHLLTHPSSLLLQRFEALMALTNLASIDPSIASKIVTATITPLKVDATWRGSGRDDQVRIIARIEEMMLDDNELVRRAATELVCNLINSSDGFEYFSGESSTSTSEQPNARVRSRSNVLVVLTSVDDLQTRLAAGGALAVITESSMACRALLMGDLDQDQTQSHTTTFTTTSKRTIWQRVSELLDPDEEEEEIDENGEKIPIISSAPTAVPNLDLVHRGVIILHNLVQYTLGRPGDAKKDGLKGIKDADVEGNLMGVLRMKVGQEVLVPTVECLKMLKRGTVA